MSSPDDRWEQRFADYRRRTMAERDRLAAMMPNAIEHQQRTLMQVLEANKDTAFGVKHGFGSIRTMDEYRRAVPIHDYAALAPWIDRAASGEQAVLTAERPVVFLRSSGTTGTNKQIPITPTFMRTSFFPFYFAAWAGLAEHFPDAVRGRNAMLNLKHDPVVVSRTTAAGSPHLGASQVDFGTAFGEPLSAEPGSKADWTVLPVEVAADDHLAKDYLRLLLALEHDLRGVIGINPSMIAAVPFQLKLWWPRLIRDLHDGTIDGAPGRSPNRDRAKELERLAEYFGDVRPSFVWPRLRVIFCWSTGQATLYLPRLREAFGSGVTILPAPVAASEGPVAVALDRHGSAGSPVVDAACYEFVDADAEITPDTATQLLPDLEPGRDYHVLYTHIGGLYRYAVGDVVHVVDRALGVPRLEYAGRGNRSSVAGERLREGQIITAVSAAVAATGVELNGMTCRAESGASGYHFLLAARLPCSAGEARALAQSLDEQLDRVSATYQSARSSRALGPASVTVVEAAAFQTNWLERVKAGVRPTQVKDRTIERDDANWRRLLEFALPRGKE